MRILHTPTRLLRACALLALPALCVPALATAQGGRPGDEGLARPDTAAAPVTRVIVRFKSSADAGERADARREAGTPLEETLPVSGMQLVDPKPGLSVRSAIARLERSPDVLYAEADVPRHVVASPNDDFFVRQWGLHNTGQTLYSGDAPGTPDADVDGPEAWQVTTGSPSVAVGVVDTGVDVTHPDLAPNRWTNPGESGGNRESNGVDDDGNGRIDDVHGWDWVDDDASPDDLEGHGTHVAGTLGARGNDDTGVAGVSWTSKIAPLRVLDANGSGYVSDAIQAYTYAGRTGLRVVNASLGGSQASQSERDAIARASNTLFVVAAGNGGGDDIGDDNDVAGEYPCSYDVPNLVCVAASDDRDGLASFSNFGARAVDLAAPGVDIASTYPGGRWMYMDGTSMASPHVAGGAALVLARVPGASTAAVRATLLATVDRKAAFSCTTVTGGRLNVFRAVSAMAPGGTAPQVPTDDPCETGAGGSTPPTSVAPPAEPEPAADTTPPALTISTPSRQRLGTVLRRGLRPRIGSSETGSVTATVEVGSRTARRYRLARTSGTTRIGTVTRSWTVAGARTVTVRLSRRARRRLARARSVSVTLRVRGVDSAGNASTRTKRVTLRR